MTWRRLSTCESHACPEWQVVDGMVRLRSSERPLEVIEMTPDEMAALVAAWQAGEVVPRTTTVA